MKKSSVELLVEYLNIMSDKEIQADWDAVKTLKFDGTTIDDLLESNNNEVYRNKSRTSPMAKLK